MVHTRVEADLVEKDHVCCGSPSEWSVLNEALERLKRRHTVCAKRIGGEMYEAVTRCVLYFKHSCAMAGWNDTGSRLWKFQHKQALLNDAEHAPGNNVGLFNRLRSSYLIAHVDEDSRRIGVVGTKSFRFIEDFAC